MKQLETFLKLIIIGVLTAVVRAYSQSFIPLDLEPLLWPSIFVDGEIQVLAFIIFGSIYYTFIAALFLMIEKKMKGNKLLKGLKFSIVLIIIWTAYLLEPLPHVTISDKLAYPLVDGGALLILGILTGVFIGTKNANSDLKCEKLKGNHEVYEGDKDRELAIIVDNILSLEDSELKENNDLREGKVIGAVKEASIEPALSLEQDFEQEVDDVRENICCEIEEKHSGKFRFSVLNVIIIGLIFFLGRIAMYKYFRIYSSFGTNGVETLIWVLITGFIIGSVYEVTNYTICERMWFIRFLTFGFIFLGIILIGFNGFKPLIYRMDVIDLFKRIGGDVTSVILGGSICALFDLTLSRKKKRQY